MNNPCVSMYCLHLKLLDSCPSLVLGGSIRVAPEQNLFVFMAHPLGCPLSCPCSALRDENGSLRTGTDVQGMPPPLEMSVMTASCRAFPDRPGWTPSGLALRLGLRGRLSSPSRVACACPCHPSNSPPPPFTHG